MIKCGHLNYKISKHVHVSSTFGKLLRRDLKKFWLKIIIVFLICWHTVLFLYATTNKCGTLSLIVKEVPLIWWSHFIISSICIKLYFYNEQICISKIIMKNCEKKIMERQQGNQNVESWISFNTLPCRKGWLEFNYFSKNWLKYMA
jgi:hypothetical protein